MNTCNPPKKKVKLILIEVVVPEVPVQILSVLSSWRQSLRGGGWNGNFCSLGINFSRDLVFRQIWIYGLLLLLTVVMHNFYLQGLICSPNESHQVFRITSFLGARDSRVLSFMFFRFEVAALWLVPFITNLLDVHLTFDCSYSLSTSLPHIFADGTRLSNFLMSVSDMVLVGWWPLHSFDIARLWGIILSHRLVLLSISILLVTFLVSWTLLTLTPFFAGGIGLDKSWSCASGGILFVWGPDPHLRERLQWSIVRIDSCEKTYAPLPPFLARPYSIKSLCTVLRSWCDVGFKVRSLVKDFVYQLLAYSPSTDDSFGFQSCIMRSVPGILHWTYFDYTPRNSSRFSCRFFKPRDIFTEQDCQETITMATGEEELLIFAKPTRSRLLRTS